MAGRIRQEDVEAVKERTDIVKLVGQYLTLKKSGHDSLSGLCPFHQEKTASFSVSPAKQLFYCFGCGKGGDSVKFLVELEHLTFVEAIERLAQQAGVTLRYEGDSPAERRRAARRLSLHRANEEAAELYHRMLVEGREAADARTYLAERGIDPAAAEHFGVGFAPGYPDFLLRRLTQLGPEILLEAGLASRGDDGTVRDRFRARITFPVHDLQGRGVGIGARILPSDPRAGEQAKYLNTAETPIYRKNELLYNLHRARGPIATSGEAFVVEGYTDVIALHQAGIENAVATCGTALGEEHFRLLSRFAQRAILAFDSDEAGARAAERAFAFQEAYPVQAIVMVLPQGLDPADMVRQHGAEAVHLAAKEGRPLVEYMLRRTIGRHDLSTVEGRSAAVASVMPILQRLSDPVRRSEYGHLVADLAGVAEHSVLATMEQHGGAARPTDVAKAVRRGTAQERVEREMLKLLVRDTEIFRAIEPRLTEDHFRSAPARRAYVAIREAGGDVASLAGGADEKMAASVSALVVEPLDGEETREYAEHVWARLQELMLKGRSDTLRLRLQKLNPTTEREYDELFNELVAIDGELRRLRHGTPDVA